MEVELPLLLLLVRREGLLVRKARQDADLITC